MAGARVKERRRGARTVAVQVRRLAARRRVADAGRHVVMALVGDDAVARLRRRLCPALRRLRQRRRRSAGALCRRHLRHHRRHQRTSHQRRQPVSLSAFMFHILTLS